MAEYLTLNIYIRRCSFFIYFQPHMQKRSCRILLPAPVPDLICVQPNRDGNCTTNDDITEDSLQWLARFLLRFVSTFHNKLCSNCKFEVFLNMLRKTRRKNLCCGNLSQPLIYIDWSAEEAGFKAGVIT
jgi:hypothetical protein